jgi:TolB protein
VNARRLIRPAIVLILPLASSTVALPAQAGEIPQPEQRIYDSCGFDFILDICSMNPDGTGEVMLTNDGSNDYDPELSPNGTTLAWTKFVDQIWVMKPDGSNQHQLKDFGAPAYAPTWSPDGKKIAFGCWTPGGGPQGICIANADGSGYELVYASTGATQPDWSPDGSTILFESAAGMDAYDIFALNVGSARSIAGAQAVNLTNTPDLDERGARWSPDGTGVAFFGEDPGGNGFYTMNPDGSSRQLLFKPMFFAHPSSPAWAPDGMSLALICDQLAGNSREMCIVDADSGSLADVLEVNAGHLSEGWTEPSWGSTGGVPQGDIDCSGGADPIDSLKLLRFDAGLPISNTNPCADIGEQVLIGDLALTWGDVDCDGSVNPVDSLKVLRFDAGLPVAQEPGCPPMGEFLA